MITSAISALSPIAHQLEPVLVPGPSADSSTEPDLILTDLLGEGAAGYVFSGIAEDGSQFAVSSTFEERPGDALQRSIYL
jgi:hypothetical protein